MKTRILVITENFVGGGLETHIIGQARVLSSLGVDLLLATGSSAADCPDNVFAAMITDLKLGAQVTFEELFFTLERIKQFITEERITLIHAHPFYSAVVGFLAAQQSRLPFVVTIHGPLSFSKGFGQIYNFLHNSVILPAAGRVYCVSKETELLCRSAAECRIELLPNAVELTATDSTNSAKDGPWLWAGRLDADKSNGLLDLIEKIDRLAVRELHIFGDGAHFQAISSFLSDRPDKAEFVRLMGWNHDLTKIIPSYAGVAGMGRVLLEGAAANKPCLLVGYDGVKGLLDDRKIELASFWNLSGRGLPTITAKDLREDFNRMSEDKDSFLHHEWITLYRDERVIWQRYAQSIKDLAPVDDPSTQEILNVLQYRGFIPEPVWWDGELLQIVLDLFPNLSFREGLSASMANQIVITQFHQMVEKLEGQITSLNQAVAERESQITKLNHTVEELEGQITNLNQMLTDRDGQVASLQKQLQDTWMSISWKITRPIRLIKHFAIFLFSKENQYQLAKNIYWNLPRTLQIRLSPLRQYFVSKRLMQSNNQIVNKFQSNLNDISLAWVDEANKAQRVVIIPCAFEFEELYNQRPINASLYFAKKGYFVIYVAWQWTSDENLKKGCQKVKNGIYQVPLYDFLSALDKLNIRSDNASFFLITFPADHFVKSARCLRSKGFFVMYDIMDEWECFAHVGQAPWYDKQSEHSLVLESDLVTAVSPPLAEKFNCLRNDIEVVGNGFSSIALNEHMKFICVQDSSQRKEIIIGYFGHLTDSWFDWNLLFATAQQVDTIKFEIIGYGAPEWIKEKASKITNIKLVGKVPPKELYKYARHWSAGLIPFRSGELAEAVDPIKVYEYLFFGLPVVATGIRHLERYPLVRFAATKEEFIKAIIDVININMLAYKDQLEAFLNNCTWDERFATIENLSEQELIRSLYAK